MPLFSTAAKKCAAWGQHPANYHIFILTLSLLTAGVLWFTHQQVFDTASLQILWQARHQPNDIFQYFLAPVVPNDQWAVLWAMVISSAYLWLFCCVSLQIGIGRQTTLMLFLLLNFNPEFNAVRLQISPIQPVVFLWLIGVYGFLRSQNLYRACGVWIISAWLTVLFEPLAVIWVLAFPVGLLLWSAGGRWSLAQRAGVVFLYYGTIAALVALVPPWRAAILPLWRELSEQLLLSRSEMAFFLSADNQFELSAGDGFLLSATLVAINALKIMGLLIVAQCAFAIWRGLKSVLNRPIRYFFYYCLLCSWIISALSFMYYGYLPSDLLATPITMLALWLSSGAAFHALQRWKSPTARPERRLILFWLMVAYAIASVIPFGPTSGYLRVAGAWSQHHPPTNGGKIFSNYYSVLYYAGKSPLMDDNPAYLDLDHPLTAFYDLRPQDLLLHVQSRKKPLPDNMQFFDIVKKFKNNRGDTVYALHLKKDQ